MPTRYRCITARKMMKVAAAISDAISISSSRSRMRRNINSPVRIIPEAVRMIWRDPFLRPVAAAPRQQRGFRAESMEAPVVSVGRAPRLLEELVDQRLADARCHVLVNRIQRLAHGLFAPRRV